MGAELERAAGEPRQFSISGGPFVRVLHRIHLTRKDGTPRAWAFVSLAWGPLFVGALFHGILGQRPAPILFDLSVHVRLLLGIPLLIAAERLLQQRCRGAVRSLYAGRFAERTAIDRIIDRAERMRDSRLVEIALIAVVVLAGQAVVWGLVGPTGLIAGVGEAGTTSFTRLWYVAVALPIVQFLMVRWLWHWVIWSCIVIRVSRLPLATLATHPDHAAGLGFLGMPLAAFSAYVFAVSATMAAAWATKILAGQATLAALLPSFAVFVVLALLLACGPLFLFIGTLARTRYRDLARYNALALEFVRGFHHKWIETRPEAEPLVSTPDISAWNDLCGGYASLVQVRLVPFGRRAVVSLVVAAAIPMLPLVATTMPLDELLGKIGRALLGGLPA